MPLVKDWYLTGVTDADYLGFICFLEERHTKRLALMQIVGETNDHYIIRRSEYYEEKPTEYWLTVLDVTHKKTMESLRGDISPLEIMERSNDGNALRVRLEGKE